MRLYIVLAAVNEERERETEIIITFLVILYMYIVYYFFLVAFSFPTTLLETRFVGLFSIALKSRFKVH